MGHQNEMRAPRLAFDPGRPQPKTALDRLVEQRVAQLRCKLEKERKIAEETKHGDLILIRRERYAIRRLARQLKSTARKDGDREVLYLDPLLACNMYGKGLVEFLDGRKPENMILIPDGRVVFAGNINAEPEVHVPSTLTERGKRLLGTLMEMEGD